MREGQYLSWASGPRSCPGRKFSQVEFVAALATLFQDCIVEVKPRVVGEGLDGARRRLEGVIEDSRIGGVTLQMRRPREVEVVWRRV